MVFYLDMLLNKNQIDDLIGDSVLDHKGTNVYGVCPMCKYSEFGISLKENHPFQCFRAKNCGFSGNIFTLLSFLGRSKDFIQDRKVDAFGKLTSILRGVDVDLLEVEIDLSESSMPVLWQRSFDDVYLRKRGFVDYQFNKFEIGRSKINKDYVTFLVRQEGKLIGHITRSDKSKQEIDEINVSRKQKGEKEYLRYKNSTTDFAKTLFGLDEIVPGVTEDVILVEGILSKTKTDLNLKLDYQETFKCCATFGAKLSIEQIEWLKRKGVKRLIFWFEADVLNKIKRIVSEAALHFQVYVCYLNGKDPNDLNQDEAFKLLYSMVDWFEFNNSYIANRLLIK